MIIVLRIGHRVERDRRITTHVGLVARAFGADGIAISGDLAKDQIESLNRVVDRWGGNFNIEYARSWKKFLNEHLNFKSIYLTIYGMPINEKIDEIREIRNLIVVVGSEKAPKELYEMVDYNISITSQPHSEVAALAIFLHEYWKGEELDLRFDGKLKVLPMEHGKNVLSI